MATGHGSKEMWGGGGQCGKKNVLHWALELVKVIHGNTETHVHKTTVPIDL
jgi:hypothetical protein